MAKPWEPWQIELLEKEYGKTPTDALAEKIGKQRQAVIQYAYNHKVSANRYFTQEEEDFIQEAFGRLTSRKISKILGRDYQAVKKKVYKMGLGTFLDNSEHLHLASVCELVNRDKETIKSVWFKNGLKNFHKGRYVMISEKELVKFMKEHPQYWDATEVDYYFFRKYKWFEEKRKADFDKMVERKWGELA